MITHIAVIPKMCRGQRCKVTIPPELAYGHEGFPPVVPPDSPVVYEIELLSFSSIGTTSEYLQRETKQTSSLIKDFRWHNSIVGHNAYSVCYLGAEMIVYFVRLRTNYLMVLNIIVTVPTVSLFAASTSSCQLVLSSVSVFIRSVCDEWLCVERH
jgi:hypothetical protein